MQNIDMLLGIIVACCTVTVTSRAVSAITGLSRFASEREGALIADEMGLGKSIQAIGVINEDPTIRKVIIVCPASMRIPWRREMERWLDRPLSIGVIGVDNGSPNDLFIKNVVIINYDRLTRFTRELSACIYDLCVLSHDPVNDVTLIIWTNLTVSLDGQPTATSSPPQGDQILTDRNSAGRKPFGIELLSTDVSGQHCSETEPASPSRNWPTGESQRKRSRPFAALAD